MKSLSTDPKPSAMSMTSGAFSASPSSTDANSGGTSGSIGGGNLGRALGALAGGSRSAHMAIDLRVVDATTSRVLAATSVEGEARDFNIGGAIAGYTGSYGLGGSLSSWKNTPREKALRQVIGAAAGKFGQRPDRLPG